jgi:hypothetical protein
MSVGPCRRPPVRATVRERRRRPLPGLQSRSSGQHLLHEPDRQRRRAVDGWRWRPPLILMIIAVAGSLTFTNVGKAIVGRPRPRLTDAVPPYEHAFPFPPGQALNSTVIAGLVAYLVASRSLAASASPCVSSWPSPGQRRWGPAGTLEFWLKLKTKKPFAFLTRQVRRLSGFLGPPDLPGIPLLQIAGQVTPIQAAPITRDGESYVVHNEVASTAMRRLVEARHDPGSPQSEQTAFDLVDVPAGLNRLSCRRVTPMSRCRASIAAIRAAASSIASAIPSSRQTTPATAAAFSPELASRLERSFAVLGAARRGAVAHHQTLRATIDTAAARSANSCTASAWVIARTPPRCPGCSGRPGR